MIDEVQGLVRFRELIEESNWEYSIREDLLLCFLRARKYNVDRAFKSLKHYLKMRSSYPDLLTNLTASKLRTQLKEQLQTIYKSRDKHGRRIFIFRAGRWNPSTLTLDDIFRCNVFCLQKLASQLDAQLNGIVAIVDLGNLGVNQAKHFTPLYAKKIADLLTGAFPLSIQVIHIVNQNWIVSMLMSIIWPFLSTKIQQRVHYHGTCWSSLQEYVDAADLPEDYGGSREKLDYYQGADEISSDEVQNLFDLK